MGNALLLEYLYALVMIGLQADSALGIESDGSLSCIEQNYSRGSRVRLNGWRKSAAACVRVPGA